MDAPTATAIVLACAESSLPQTAEELLAMAAELGRLADRCHIPKGDLDAAANRLSMADDAGLPDVVSELGRTATALGEQAASFARACDGFGRLFTAIKLVRDKELAPRTGWAGRIKAWWAEWRKRCVGKESDETAQALLLGSNQISEHQGAPGGDPPACSESQVSNLSSSWVGIEVERAVLGGDRVCADWDDAGARKVLDGVLLCVACRVAVGTKVMHRFSIMHSCALLGSLALIPYLESDGVLNTDTYDEDYKRVVCNVLSSYWGLVGLGVSCSFARSHYLHLYARVSARLGMLGVTIFVIFFCHWLLDPKGATHWLFVSVAVGLHAVLFLRSCIQGDM